MRERLKDTNRKRKTVCNIKYRREGRVRLCREREGKRGRIDTERINREGNVTVE